MKLQIGERTLSNGLTIIAVQNAGVHTYAAGMVLDVDMRDESPEEEGVANLIGDCLDEGTKQRSGVELAMAVDELGGRLIGTASGGTVMCPAKNREDALPLLREMVFEPEFAEREVHRVRDEVLQEIKVEESDPREVASLRFQKEVYGAHPFSRPARGSAEAVAARGPDACIAGMPGTSSITVCITRSPGATSGVFRSASGDAAGSSSSKFSSGSTLMTVTQSIRPFRQASSSFATSAAGIAFRSRS